MQDVDFIRFHNFKESNDNRTLDYHISLSMAKELCMIERTDKGKNARLYFIECEKRLRTAYAGG